MNERDIAPSIRTPHAASSPPVAAHPRAPPHVAVQKQARRHRKFRINEAICSVSRKSDAVALRVLRGTFIARKHPCMTRSERVVAVGCGAATHPPFGAFGASSQSCAVPQTRAVHLTAASSDLLPARRVAFP